MKRRRLDVSMLIFYISLRAVLRRVWTNARVSALPLLVDDRGEILAVRLDCGLQTPLREELLVQLLLHLELFEERVTDVRHRLYQFVAHELV